MATDAPITGALTGAREITSWSVSSQAADAGLLMDNIITLVDCIRRFSDDLSPIPDPHMLHTMNCMACVTETIEIVAMKARDALGKIELDVRHLEPKGA